MQWDKGEVREYGEVRCSGVRGRGGRQRGKMQCGKGDGREGDRGRQREIHNKLTTLHEFPSVVCCTAAASWGGRNYLTTHI